MILFETLSPLIPGLVQKLGYVLAQVVFFMAPGRFFKYATSIKEEAEEIKGFKKLMVIDFVVVTDLSYSPNTGEKYESWISGLWAPLQISLGNGMH